MWFQVKLRIRVCELNSPAGLFALHSNVGDSMRFVMVIFTCRVMADGGFNHSMVFLVFEIFDIVPYMPALSFYMIY